MGIGGKEQDNVHEEVRGASPILLKAPSMSSHEREKCRQLLTVTDPADTSIGVIPYAPHSSASTWVQRWRDAVGDLPAHLWIIDVGATTRESEAHPLSEQLGDTAIQLEIETIESPTDLTNLGVTVNELLLHEPSDTKGVAICFDSITPLLQNVDPQTAFNFLHALINRVGTVNAGIHFHLDPAAHSEQEVASLLPLFNRVIELSGDGDGWSVTTR